jgi:myo-inositol 2-dehydrogenase/D-chiro-inositol 1-dehydrogenase
LYDRKFRIAFCAALGENANTPIFLQEQPMKRSTRRTFLKASAVAGGTLALNNIAANAFQNGNDTIKVGLVGCGGRGTGAIEQNLRADSNCKLVAVGEAFRDRANDLLQRLRNHRDQDLRAKVDVNAERVFIGLDAYQRVIEQSDLVILATPPGFRPIHIDAAIRARKHLFTEKPVAVDGPGVRTVLAAYELANTNNLCVVAGTQRRYEPFYLESMSRIRDGALGTITSARAYWNQGRLWHRTREEGMTDIAWQLRNWLYFTWLSGDHICEQHIHNLDVVNWALGNSHPEKAMGMGGRQVRIAPEFGHIFDHFAVDFTYPNDTHVLSMCRQIEGCANGVAEAVVGTRGAWSSANSAITGERAWRYPRNRRNDPDPYQEEHIALYRAIRNGPRINDLKNVAESTLTAIMGRMTCYTGKEVTWDQALNSRESLMPANLTWDTPMPVPPVAIPGTTQVK